MSKEFKTVQVTKSDLVIALDNNKYWANSGKNIPFTKSKARWMLDNPRMEEDDICAILGYEGDELVAFAYLIPDLIRVGKVDKKIFWCRRWWVAPRYKNSVLATYTMNEAVTAVNNQVVIKFLGKDVVDFYKKQPYVEFSERIRYFIVFNLDAGLITNKISFLKPFKSVFKLGERISTKIIRWNNARKIKNSIQKLSYEYLSTIDNNTWNFLKERLRNDFVVKTKEFISWQLSNDQYTITPVAEKFPFNCLIAGASFQIYQINFNVILQQQIIGFVSVLVRANEFNVRYFIADDEYYDFCLDALIDNFNKTKTNTIHTENEKLGNRILKKYSKIYVDKRKLYSLGHKNVGVDFLPIEIEDQDGHFA